MITTQKIVGDDVRRLTLSAHCKFQTGTPVPQPHFVPGRSGSPILASSSCAAKLMDIPNPGLWHGTIVQPLHNTKARAAHALSRTNVVLI